MTKSISVEEFYSKDGQKLIDVELYPEKIHQHLNDEKATLVNIIRNGNYDTVVEVGCMDGTMHLDVCKLCDVNYVGLDLVEHSVELLNQKLMESGCHGQYIAKALDVINIDSIAPDINEISRKVLVFFPFNSFGNLDHPKEVLSVIRSCDYDAVVLTYLTDDNSANVRMEYYSNCGYSNLELSKSNEGDLFSSAQGLRSYAYSYDWFQNVADENSYKVKFSKIGEISGCYLLER